MPATLAIQFPSFQIPGTLALLLAAASAHAASVTFQSSEKRTALLELYTSEGCSSCPPAESWLSRLTKSSGLWKEFVPLAFHVDYWDNLGWPDPWAAGQFSDRQRAYAQSWHSRRIYTPEFVLNGKEWRNWSGNKNGPASSDATPGVLKISSTDLAHWQVTFAPANPSGAGVPPASPESVSGAGVPPASSSGRSPPSYEAHAALLANGISSRVKAGENSGRRLDHDFVVTALVKTTLTSTNRNALGEFTLQPKSKEPSAHLALAVWLTLPGRPEPLQAAGAWLPKPHTN
jgi:hypothetical protein